MKINEKLLQVQAKLKAPKNRNNSFGKYKYRSCEDILEAVKPLLVENGLTLTLSDSVSEIAGTPVISAKVKLSDGEDSIEVTSHAGIELNKKGMDVAQTFGTSSSYARKYALNGMFLIDDTKDYDTDEHHNHQQAGLAQDFNRAIHDIKKASDPVVLTNAYNYFKGTEFEGKIVAECKAKKQQAGWT